MNVELDAAAKDLARQVSYWIDSDPSAEKERDEFVEAFVTFIRELKALIERFRGSKLS